jgi:hypothetical protein
MAAHPDTLIRLAMILLAQDLTAALTDGQRTWLHTRLQMRTPLTPTERTKLRPVLLSWAAHRLHASTVARLQAAFDEGVACPPTTS